MKNRFSIDSVPSDVSFQLSQNLKALRKQKKMTQRELSERSGVSLGSLKRFENTGEISLTFLLKIAHVLDRLNEFEKLLEPQKDLERIEKLFSDKTKKQ